MLLQMISVALLEQPGDKQKKWEKKMVDLEDCNLFQKVVLNEIKNAFLQSFSCMLLY